MKSNSTQSKIKQYFYSGVGFAAHSSDIMRSVIKEFVSQEKISEKEGERIVKESIKKIEARYNDAVNKVSTYASSEISMLRKKIEGLEKKAGVKSPASAKAANAAKKAVKAVAKKAATKKTAAKKTAKKPAAKKAATRKPAKKAARA